MAVKTGPNNRTVEANNVTSCPAIATEVLTSRARAGTEPRNRVGIDLPASYGRLHALPVILKCAEDHALLPPHISFSDWLADLVALGIDLLVRIGGPDVWPAASGHRYWARSG